MIYLSMKTRKKNTCLISSSRTNMQIEHGQHSDTRTPRLCRVNRADTSPPSFNSPLWSATIYRLFTLVVYLPHTQKMFSKCQNPFNVGRRENHAEMRSWSLYMILIISNRANIFLPSHSLNTLIRT